VGVLKMAEPITLQKLVSADADADTLGEFANEDKMVVSRKGLEYPSAPMASRLLVENGLLGATPFSTYAAMTGSALADGDYAVVTNDSAIDKNGVYQNVAGNWTYLKYNLQPQINTIANTVNKLAKPSLRILLDDLNNPLLSVNIKLIGDSITWGVGASNASPRDPYNKNLLDGRNTTDVISPSWANLLRQWLVKSFTDGDIVDEGMGSAYGQSDNMVLWSANLKNINVIDTRKNTVFNYAAAQAVIEATTSTLVPSREYINLYNVNNTTSSQVPTAIEFVANGDGVTLVYAKLTFGTDSTYFASVYVDGVFKQKISAYGTTAGFNNEFFISLPDDGKHTIRIVNDGSTNSVVRIQHIKATKVIRVKNDGISGATTHNWLNTIKLSQSITPKDDHVFIMLGTNDRIAIADNNQRALANNLRKIVSDTYALTNNKANIILMSANAVTQDQNPDTSPYYMTMQTVNSEVKRAADDLGLSFISNYDATTQLKIDGASYLADGLHPNDTGYRVIFDNIRNAISKS